MAATLIEALRIKSIFILSLSRLPVFVLLIIVMSLPVEVSADAVENVDALAQQWVAIAGQRTVIRSNWLERERVGRNQVKLLKAERSALREFLNEAAQSDNKIDEQRAALFSEQQQLEERDAALERELTLAIDQLTVMQKRLPPPLQSNWADQLALLTAEGSTISEQLSTVLALLNGTAEFKKRIALHKTRMTFNGREFLVTQLYLGLSHGWYVSEDGVNSGSGRAYEDGWLWQDESANPFFDKIQLSDTIEQVEARVARGLVSLPISLASPK
jgi:hypothetical protein|tara:strand:- start:451 stop:1269 length:819 start_codon:yes stop_codon:yes gene_type:complete